MKRTLCHAVTAGGLAALLAGCGPSEGNRAEPGPAENSAELEIANIAPAPEPTLSLIHI